MKLPAIARIGPTGAVTYDLADLVPSALARTMDFGVDIPVSPAELFAGSVGPSNYDRSDDRKIEGTVSVTPQPDGSRKTVRGDLKGTGNIAAAAAVGKAIAEKAKAAGIKQVAFDRSGYRYHGRIKALADAARENGLEF